MTPETTPGNPAPRHVYGPRPIGALVPVVTRTAFRKRAPGAAQVMADWAQIVGPALSAVTTPRRLSAGTLTLACAGPVALELQHLSGELLARVNGHLGRTVVERLRFVQDPAVQAPRVAAPARRPAAVVEVTGIAPGPLHEALIALGRCIAATDPI
ncbi:MAG: DUF721 domain-containing protein [Gemmatimonadaceae bacterium]|nr:DUF721 domain-containing protein [Acetobacteraceae bacterium]